MLRGMKNVSLHQSSARVAEADARDWQHGEQYQYLDQSELRILLDWQ
jgi:hypothetical protein